MSPDWMPCARLVSGVGTGGLGAARFALVWSGLALSAGVCSTALCCSLTAFFSSTFGRAALSVIFGFASLGAAWLDASEAASLVGFFPDFDPALGVKVSSSLPSLMLASPWSGLPGWPHLPR